ncbi:MAG: hypothetical protein ABWY20_02405 [Mycobacterium sp.]
MSAVEEIQAAIEKLNRQRELANPGPWMHLDSGDVVMGDRADPVDAYPMVAECAHLNDADLIETLHATIDAQLAILRAASNDEWEAKEHWAEVGKPHLRGPAKIVPINMAALALARTINGATS